MMVQPYECTKNLSVTHFKMVNFMHELCMSFLKGAQPKALSHLLSRARTHTGAGEGKRERERPREPVREAVSFVLMNIYDQNDMKMLISILKANLLHYQRTGRCSDSHN